MVSYSIRKLVIGYSIAVIVVFLIIWIAFSSLRSQERELRNISKTREVLQKLEPSLVDLQEFESNLNNVLFFKKEAYAAAYSEGFKKMRDDSALLAQLSISHPENKTSYLQLAALLHEMSSFADFVLQLHKERNTGIASSHWNKDSGSSIVTEFKTIVDKLEAGSRQSLSISYNNSINLTRRTFAFVRIISAILILILGISFFLIWRDLRNREKKQEELKMFNEELERKVEEKTKEVKDSETKFRNLVEKSLVGVYIMQDGVFVYVNPRFAEIFGYDDEELINSFPVETVVHPGDRIVLAENIRARMSGEKESIHYEINGLRKDGGIIQTEVFGTRTIYAGKTAIIGTLLDISDRKKIEEDKERVLYLLNERVKELTTLYQSSQVLQEEHKSIEDVLQAITFILPPGWQYPEITAARIILGEKEFTSSNFAPGRHRQTAEFPSPDGTTGVVEVVYLEQRPAAAEDAFLAEERALINMIAEMIRVYLARKQGTEALMKSEANLTTIFETTDDGYALLDENFGIISYNQRGLDFVVNELNGKPGTSNNLMDFIPPERRALLLNMKDKVLNAGHVGYEVSYRQPDDSYKWYYIRMFPVTNTEKKIFGLMIAVADTTEKKLMEQEMMDQKVQEQKKIIRAVLKAEEKEKNRIGQELHDNVNQILASIKLYLGMAKDRDVKDGNEFLVNSSELVDNAIEEIRALSKSQVTPFKHINLGELIQSLVDKLNDTTSLKTTYVYSAQNLFIDDDLKLNIYRIVQEQINNILKHAAARSINIVLTLTDSFLQLTIEDDGKGFNPDKKRNGIGVSNMINRVESFNGELELKSSPGNGCTLTIKIPC